MRSAIVAAGEWDRGLPTEVAPLAIDWWMAERRWALSSAAEPIVHVAGRPISNRDALTQVAKKLSSVPMARRSSDCVTRTRRSRKKIQSAVGCWMAAARSPVASGDCGSAAIASLWSTRARISPAALRANVAANTSSTDAPSASSWIMRVVSAYVLPLPALARTVTNGSTVAAEAMAVDWFADFLEAMSIR